MPKYDTYRCIERFAQDPKSIPASLAFYGLMRVAEADLCWSALTQGRGLNSGSMQELLELRMNLVKPAGGQSAESTDELANMNEESRLRFYARICGTMGIELPDDLKKR